MKRSFLECDKCGLMAAMPETEMPDTAEDFPKGWSLARVWVNAGDSQATTERHWCVLCWEDINRGAGSEVEPEGAGE
jgi:hypothetical protein